MPGYTYRGTKRGTLDPWAEPEPSPAPPDDPAEQKPRKPRKRRKVAPCGTNAGYTRHRRDNEDACTPCKNARNVYTAQYRKSLGQKKEAS